MALRVRAFGEQRSDLDIRFDPSEPASAISAILAACIEDGPGQGWELPISHRLVLMLAVVRVTESTDRIHAYGRCSAPECNGEMEVDLPEEELRSLAPRDIGARLRMKTHDNKPIALRLPTGEDQRAWLQSRGEASSPLALARSLVCEGNPESLTEADLDPIGAAFEDIDALAALRVTLHCPHCGMEQMMPVDLQHILLSKVAHVQRRRITEAHKLAQRYGWSEAEIFDVPLWRRLYYLQLGEAAL